MNEKTIKIKPNVNWPEIAKQICDEGSHIGITLGIVRINEVLRTIAQRALELNAKSIIEELTNIGVITQDINTSRDLDEIVLDITLEREEAEETSLDKFATELADADVNHDDDPFIPEAIVSAINNIELLLEEYDFEPTSISNQFSKGKRYIAVISNDVSVTICKYTPKYKRLIDTTTFTSRKQLKKYLEQNHCY